MFTSAQVKAIISDPGARYFSPTRPSPDLTQEVAPEKLEILPS
jgi:hypothetical protein